MSDLLIKNLELPVENAQLHISILSDGTVVENFQNIKGKWVTFKMDSVKAVSLPSHGRLIDADRLKADNPQHMNADVPYVTEVTVAEIIDEAPTVLEASK